MSKISEDWTNVLNRERKLRYGGMAVAVAISCAGLALSVYGFIQVDQNTKAVKEESCQEVHNGGRPTTEQANAIPRDMKSCQSDEKPISTRCNPPQKPKMG